MINTSFKDVTIKDRKFRITRMSPLVGVRVMNVLFAAIAKLQQPEGEESSASRKEFEKLSEEEKGDVAIQSMWTAAAAVLTSDVYEEIQKACLRSCQVYPTDNENDHPLPVMMANGKWAMAEPGLTETSELILKALQFNLGPFFTESASKKADSAAQLSNQ